MTAKRERKQDAVPITTAYKGFNRDWTCRGMKYEIGVTYTHEGKVIRCTSAGFHACEMPLDVLTYYPASTSRYAVVEVGGDKDSDKDGDSKIACAEITVRAEIMLPDLIKKAVAWVLDRAKGNTATGTSGHAAATGYYGHAAATGTFGHAAATGDYGHAAATGTSGHAAATGDYGVAFAGFGGRAKASSTGAIAIAWHDGERTRIASADVGENGIKADTWYCVEKGVFVECKE